MLSNDRDAPEEFFGASLKYEPLDDLPFRDYWDWAADGACNRYYAIFESRSKQLMAKTMCTTLCPVAKDCLIWSLLYKEQGLWGGMTRGERDKEFTPDFVERLREKAKLHRVWYRQATSLAPFAQAIQER